jgi:outer membrane protein
MKKLFVAAAMALVLGTSIVASAAHAEGGIGVLDLQKIMQNSLASKSIREQVEKKREQFQQEISKDEDRLRKKDKDLAEQRKTMTPEKFEQERNNFKTEVENVQREVQKKRIQLDRAYSTALAEVPEALNGVVKEIASEQKLSLAVPAGQTLYYDTKLDITENALGRLDKKISKVTIKIEPVDEVKEGLAPAKDAANGNKAAKPAAAAPKEAPKKP